MNLCHIQSSATPSLTNSNITKPILSYLAPGYLLPGYLPGLSPSQVTHWATPGLQTRAIPQGYTQASSKAFHESKG